MDLGDLSGGELLDHVDVLARRLRETEIAIIAAAYQHAVLNDADSIPGWQLKAPGAERARRFGGVGTPLVAEFSPGTLGARLGISTHAARAWMADAVDIRHRLPRLQARVQAGQVRVSYARFVAKRTRDLSREQADYVDERVVESADGRIPWSRFELLVEAAIKAADPETAAAREEAEARRQFAQPTASTLDGMRGFYVRAHFAVIARLDAAVAFFAAEAWLRHHLGPHVPQGFSTHPPGTVGVRGRSRRGGGASRGLAAAAAGDQRPSSYAVRPTRRPSSAPKVWGGCGRAVPKPRAADSITGSRRSRDGRPSSPSPASRSGATPTAPTTSSTTPAPADSATTSTTKPPDRHLTDTWPTLPAWTDLGLTRHA